MGRWSFGKQRRSDDRTLLMIWGIIVSLAIVFYALVNHANTMRQLIDRIERLEKKRR